MKNIEEQSGLKPTPKVSHDQRPVYRGSSFIGNHETIHITKELGKLSKRAGFLSFLMRFTNSEKTIFVACLLVTI